MPTFIEITNQMRKLRAPEKYPGYRVVDFKTQASPGIKTVLYRGSVRGEESEYATYMQFRNVEFSEEEKTGFIPYEATDRTGGSKMSFYKIPELNRNPVALKCSCPDFRFFAEYPLYKAKSLIGQFRRYVRVSPPSGRPPKNPENILMYCKHIWSFANALKESELVK